MAYQQQFPVSWDETHRHARALSWRIGGKAPDGAPWRGIVAVARGGLIPATIIARELGIDTIASIIVRSYQQMQQGELIVGPRPDCGTGAGWLVVDDLADTGATLRHLRQIWPQAQTAVLYVKPAGRDAADHFLAEFSQDTWIWFPWELAPTITPHHAEAADG